MALRRYSQFYSNSYKYGNSYDNVRTTYSVLRAASKQYEIERKVSKTNHNKKKGNV